MVSAPVTHHHSRRPGFTLVELLVVILIVAILIALLVPAIAGAVRSARDAQVNAEIANLSTSLASFRSQYGFYPPSRIVLAEDNFYQDGPNHGVSGAGVSSLSSSINTDITFAELRQRTLTALRKMFHRVPFGQGPIAGTSFDFNGDGRLQPEYVLDGNQCLVFFLGGIPQGEWTYSGNTPQEFRGGMSGFNKDPLRPFNPSTAGKTTNRQPPFYDFTGSRLTIFVPLSSNPNPVFFPYYIDPLSGTTVEDRRPYAYFASYGSVYDPNDINYNDSYESTNPNDSRGAPYSWDRRQFSVRNDRFIASVGPNPYCSTRAYISGQNLGNPADDQSPKFINSESFQLFSSGRDRLWGYGGDYDPNGDPKLNVTDFSGNPFPDGVSLRRQRESDNLANFSGGRLD